jgi:hypothetical protein
MTRIYENPGFWRRAILSIAFLFVAIVWGVWEFWSAATGPADAATTGYLFGALFVGGGLYALYQLAEDWRDLVSSLDFDEATGTMLVTVWQPQGPLKLAATKGQINNWRSYVKVGKRNARTFFVYADLVGYPRPLHFELRPAVDISGLRRIAPVAIAEHEAAIAPRKD